MSSNPDGHDLRISAPWSMNPRSGMALLLLVVPALLVLDHLSGFGVSLRFLYLVPIALAAWVLGQRAGVAIAAVCAGFCAFVDFSVRARAAEAALDTLSGLALFVILALVVARHRKFLDDAIALARVDEGTGLVSQREFDRVLDAEARRSRRYRRPLAVLLVDCSAVKGGATPALVAAVGRAVQSNVREGDVVGRVGDLRVGTILIECTQPLAAQVLERVRSRLEESLAPKLRGGGLSVSLVSYGGRSDSSGPQLGALARSQLQVLRSHTGIASSEAFVH